MGQPLPATPGLQDFEPQPEFVPGFRVESAADESPGFRVGTSDAGQNGSSDTHNWVWDHDPDAGVPPAFGSPADDANPSDEEGFYSLPPLYDPVYFPEPPRNPIQEALEGINRIYGISNVRQPTPSDRSTASVVGTSADREVGNGVSPAIGETFNPRYILPVQMGGQRPPSPPPAPLRIPLKSAGHSD